MHNWLFNFELARSKLNNQSYSSEADFLVIALQFHETNQFSDTLGNGIEWKHFVGRIPERFSRCSTLRCKL